MCTFCNEKPESYKHLFFECKYVQPIWESIQKDLKLTELTLYQILTNEVIRNLKHIQNAIILITKYFIYRSRCLQEKISKELAYNYINYYCKIEEQIAKNKYKLALHEMKQNLWLEGNK